MKNTEIEYWFCPLCSVRVSVKYCEVAGPDHVCSRCKKLTVSEYIPKFKKREKNETRDH